MINVHYQAGNVIYFEAQPAISMYFIKEGSVEILARVTLVNRNNIPTNNKSKESLVQKKTFEMLVKKIPQGDFFGGEEMILDCNRKNKAICVENSEILVLKKSVIFNMFGENERKQILEAHEKSPTISELQRKLKKQIKMKNNKVKALLDATNIRPLQYGRVDTDRTFYKKALIAKKLLNTLRLDINQSLIKEECFLEKKNL